MTFLTKPRKPLKRTRFKQKSPTMLLVNSNDIIFTNSLSWPKNTKSLKRTPLRKRAKSHTEGWWRNEADDLMQDINRGTGGHCEACGGVNEVGHHFITKQNSSYLRYKWENLIKLCHKCHFAHHIKSDPTISITIVKKRGLEWHDWIEAHRRLPQQTGIKYYQQIYAEFVKIRTLQENNNKL